MYALPSPNKMDGGNEIDVDSRAAIAARTATPIEPPESSDGRRCVEEVPKRMQVGTLDDRWLTACTNSSILGDLGERCCPSDCFGSESRETCRRERERYRSMESQAQRATAFKNEIAAVCPDLKVKGRVFPTIDALASILSIREGIEAR